MTVAAVLVVLLLVVGVALLAVEIFVIPGFGVIGVLGLLCVAGAAATAWLVLGATYGMAAVGGGVATSGLMFWLLPKTRAARAMVLEASHRGTAAAPDLRGLTHQHGRALTPLRPAGTAEIADRTVDVVTDGVYVEAGTAVRVVQVAGTRVVVQPIAAEEGS